MSIQADALEVSKLLQKREDELATQYRWKAENIVRFFDHLHMTTEAKVAFLARELACAQIYPNIKAPLKIACSLLDETKIKTEIKALDPIAMDYDTERQSNDTCVAAGAADALRWALGLAEASVSESILNKV